MCSKCGNNRCGGSCRSSSSSPSSNNSAAEISLLSTAIDELKNLTKFLKGHPILEINDPADIVDFDLVTGVGMNNWIGWGICNGNNYTSPAGNIATPDMRDRFLVGALGSYAVNDVGGFNSVTLISTQLPAHTHSITDPGHTHIVTDPGHDHPVTDPGHIHASSGGSHQHTFTTDAVGDHVHAGIPSLVNITTDDGTGATAADNPLAYGNSSPAGAHSHTGTTDIASVTVTLDPAFTGIDVTDAFTGITNASNTTGITIGTTGDNLPHENRPPYLALIFVKKIF